MKPQLGLIIWGRRMNPAGGPNSPKTPAEPHQATGQGSEAFSVHLAMVHLGKSSLWPCESLAGLHIHAEVAS